MRMRCQLDVQTAMPMFEAVAAGVREEEPPTDPRRDPREEKDKKKREPKPKAKVQPVKAVSVLSF